MCTPLRLFGILASLTAFVALGAGGPLRAEDAATAAWQVSKASGEVWVATSGVQQASLTDQGALKPGDQIRTGRNGRVLLVRGQETILIAPNSAITLPTTQKDAGSTTILQQAGSIKLGVDKRGERNFEVETPYLVAAVKGTEFTVTVSQGTAKVDVSHGSVEVADFKSGQIVLVMPGQSAKVTSAGQGGLSLTGAGTLNPIRNGTPRTPSVQPLSVPKGGFSAPQGQHVRALGNPSGGDGHARSAGLHIGAALGEVKLDIHKVTNGLARDNAGAGHSRGNAQATVWSNGDLLPGNGVAKTYNQGNNGSGNGAGGASSNAGGNGNGNGNSNAGGNGNGLALGLGNGNGNGNAGGNGNGNAGGNGNGNAGGNGNNGNHLGQLKH